MVLSITMAPLVVLCLLGVLSVGVDSGPYSAITTLPSESSPKTTPITPLHYTDTNNNTDTTTISPQNPVTCCETTPVPPVNTNTTPYGPPTSGPAPSSRPPPPGPLCPDGWQVFQGRCYYFVMEGMTWPQAQTNCAVLGGVLVSVRSPQENGFLHQQITDTYEDGGRPTWLGGFHLQDQWLWVDGSWFYNNSLNTDTESNTSPCLVLSPSGGWISSSCDVFLSSVCVKESNSGPPALCPEDWIGFQGQCYFYNYDALTWSDADTSCAELDASLVSVHSPQEYGQLYRITSALDMLPTWLGGFHLQGQWMWLDGSWFHQGFFSWEPPADSYPCLATSTADAWINYSCDQHFPSICVKNRL